ncbi:MAG TPA: hypothetical protein VKZ41_06960 [Gemmatimonadales bacterium]|nr:hypothetical protein [Gemmatimonadales bacterium]
MSVRTMEYHTASVHLPASPPTTAEVLNSTFAPAPAALLVVSQAGESELGAVIRERTLTAVRSGMEEALTGSQQALDAAIERGDEAAIAEATRSIEGLEQALARLSEQAESGTQIGTAVAPPPPPLPSEAIPEVPAGAVVITLAFFATIVLLALGIPLARAFLRRSSSAAVPAVADGETQAQLREIGLAVDAIAIEVERISESQRNLDRLALREGERA